MKKVLIFVVLAATLLLSACGNPTTVSNWGKEVDVLDEDAPKIDSNEQSSIIPDFTPESTTKTTIGLEDVWPSPEDVLPDPALIFTEGEINPLYSDSAGIYWVVIYDATEEQWRQYVAACKELGFTDIEYERGHDYLEFCARTIDGEYEVKTTFCGTVDINSKWLPRNELNKQWPYPDLVIPDPALIFMDAEMQYAKTPGRCSFDISNATEEQWRQYVAACKELGFTDIEYDGYDGNYFVFVASNGDYRIGVDLRSDNSDAKIICEYIPSINKL